MAKLDSKTNLKTSLNANSKLARAKNILHDRKLDAIAIFYKTPSFFYFASQNIDHSVLLITKKQSFAIVNPLHSAKISGFKPIHYKNFLEEMNKIKKQHNIKKIGIDESFILYRQKKLISKFGKTTNVADELSNLRVSKDDSEMQKIRRACEITDETFSLLLKKISSFKTEEEAATFVKMQFMMRGAECAYEPIVASGKNAAIPHHDNSDKINKGFMVLDIGAKYKGYCADMTRTIYLGTPNNEEIRLYAKVLRANLACIERARIGHSTADLHKHAEQILGNDAKYFIHSLGHGFGVEIHEAPSVAPRSKEKIQSQSVITIEPGYYNTKTGIGIRIEDDIYFAKNGKKEVLNKSSKDLICIRN